MKANNPRFDTWHGVEFTDGKSGRECRLEIWHDGDLWLFWKHPEGHWVSWRKISDRDVEVLEPVITRGIVEAHHAG